MTVQPVRLADAQSFRDFCKSLDPKFQVPGKLHPAFSFTAYFVNRCHCKQVDVIDQHSTVSYDSVMHPIWT